MVARIQTLRTSAEHSLPDRPTQVIRDLPCLLLGGAGIQHLPEEQGLAGPGLQPVQVGAREDRVLASTALQPLLRDQPPLEGRDLVRRRRWAEA